MGTSPNKAWYLCAARDLAIFFSDDPRILPKAFQFRVIHYTEINPPVHLLCFTYGTPKHKSALLSPIWSVFTIRRLNFRLASVPDRTCRDLGFPVIEHGLIFSTESLEVLNVLKIEHIQPCTFCPSSFSDMVSCGICIDQVKNPVSLPCGKSMYRRLSIFLNTP